MEPEACRADNDGAGEQRREDLPSSGAPLEPGGTADRQQQGEKAERDPAPPGFAEHLAVLEPDLGEEHQRPAEQGARDSPRDHGFTTIVPPMSSWLVPQKTLQCSGKVPALVGVIATRVTLPGSIAASIASSGTAKPCFRSSVLISRITGSPSFSSFTAGSKRKRSAVTFTTRSGAFAVESRARPMASSAPIIPPSPPPG